MNEVNTVEDYNKALLNHAFNMEMLEYFRNVQSLFYSHVDTSFMSYFLYLQEAGNSFVVTHDNLIKYNVYEPIRGAEAFSSLLLLYNFTEDIDYITTNINDTIEYTLTPKAFKIILLQKKPIKKYLEYYLLLEDIFVHYIKYQAAYNTQLIDVDDL